LVNGECDLALAGGVSVALPIKNGYLYLQGGINSPDGHCRAFDAEAKGSVGGSGAGVVVLKRLEQALEDGDTIHAVIRGTAVNNDGSDKVGFTAPSVHGQSKVIREALSVAAVEPETVGYVETHGTGTLLGDAIELRALHQVFAGERAHPCAIGSIKTNLGHLDAAAGVTGLIKAVLALEHGEIPPSLNCRTPHPEIAAGGGVLRVATELQPWVRNGTPRRAGVSSFGIGGTNAHAVLEEAPESEPSGPSREHQLLVLSARTPTALDAAAERLADALEGRAAPLPDAAYTLRIGRRAMEHRLAVVCRDAEEAVNALRGRPAGRRAGAARRPVVFLFPGTGTQYAGMGRGLYEGEPVYREAVDRCCELLRPVLGVDLRATLFAAEEDGDASALLGRTRFAQPAVFVTEYALSQLWTGWGIRPAAMIGHSLGEYTAACLAGVFRLEDALRMVALRALRIDALPGGVMLAVPLAEAELRGILPAGVDLAAVNTPGSCVAAGPAAEVEALEAVLAERGVASRRLQTSHAFHSRMVAPVAAELERLLAGCELRAPEIPFVSNVTGSWITDDEACSPAYWARHLCEPVRFAAGLDTLGRESGWAALEVGPGQALGRWASQHASAAGEEPAVFASLRPPRSGTADGRFVLEALGGLWSAGVEVDWAAFSRDERRRRVALPTYPFERERFWVERPRRAPEAPPSDPRSTQGGERAIGQPVAAPAAAPSPSPSPARREAILGRLKQIAAGLTGVPEDRIPADAHFLETGFDSLLLLQALQAVEKQLGVRVPLVQLLEEIRTLDGLADHLDAALPPDPEPAAPVREPAAAPVPRAVHPWPAAVNGDLPPATRGDAAALERIMEMQLKAVQQVVQQQLALLQGHAAPGAPTQAPARTAPPAAERKPAQPRVTGEVPQSGRARFQPETFVPFQPIRAEGAGGLTPQQQAYLDAFVARYVERTRGSREHQESSHAALADGRVTAKFRRLWKGLAYPIVGARASGSRVWDVDGNEYVDVGMSYGCNLFGHAPEFVSRAIAGQVETGYGLGPQSPLVGRAARLVCELGGNERAVFCNSGTEAVMGAIRAARTYTGRSRIAYFAGSYHGWSDSVLGRLVRRDGEAEVHPGAPGVPASQLGDVLMFDYDDPSSLEQLAGRLDEVALVLVEPVQSRRPDVQPRAFLHELRRLTREAGT
ncbi:MAG TPA: aminotransferase class III-fold pyridoxal phosphate-dependent enzyme, partial [Longimicrobiaceae bacterium]|nr:aminotransferase class III-fold pyridoxal phosphate-dependent enzyme [Longimicrobiaceae bacterium]